MATRAHGRSIENDSVGNGDLADNAVDTAQIADEAVTRSKMSTGSLPFLDAFVSADQAFVAGGLVSVAHGLGAMPGLVQILLKCTVIDDEYGVGDHIVINPGPSANDETGISVVLTTTHVNVRVGGSGIGVLGKTTGGFTPVTPASWSMIVKAWG